MVDGSFGHSVPPTVSLVSSTVNPKPEGEMDALLLGRTRELVASSPGQRNWRGIFIALLVIAAVLGLIVFSIFLLSPEDEGSRVKGRRITLSDVNGNGLKWKPFNGTWINDVELVYRDPTGGLSILSIESLTIKVLMSNSTFRQLNAEQFIVSPDLQYVLLLSDYDIEYGDARYSIYEVQSRNIFPLSPRDGATEAPKLQHVLWAPNNPMKSQNSGGHGGISGIGNGGNSKFVSSQAIAFVYENDLYYKPKVQNDLVCRITTTGTKDIIYNGIPDWLYSNTPELKSDTILFSTDGSYLSFISFNDSEVEEYKFMWLGENNNKYPHVRSIRYPKANTINPNVTVYVADLSILKFINKIQIKPPTNVPLNNSYVGNMLWISATDLTVTFTNREQTSAITILCRAPTFNCQEIHTEYIVDNDCVLPTDKSIFSKNDTYFRVAQNQTVIPSKNQTSESGQYQQQQPQGQQQQHQQAQPQPQQHRILNTNEFETGGFVLKRLPVRDGEHGYFRHVVFISMFDKRAVPLTMGRFEVTELLGWDELNEIIYFMATPELKPGQRHLYKIYLKLNVTDKPNRIFISTTPPQCLTCDNGPETFHLFTNITNPSYASVQSIINVAIVHNSNNHINNHNNMNNNNHNYNYNDNENDNDDSDNNDHINLFFSAMSDNNDADDNIEKIPENCLFNKIYFSKSFSYYVQECLGPNSPSVYLVDTRTNRKIMILHNGDLLRYRLSQLALPQIRTFSVEIRHGFHAQVRLFLPPGMKEEEEMVFPLILHTDGAPGSQLVSEKFDVDWNWYLCSQKSMIIAQIDARGSGYQGELLRSQIKNHLGSVEIEDQLGVITYLRDNLKFIDPTRICAYGWGYGGFTAAMILAEDSQRVLQCSVAINPIVSFGYHSSFFTERYILHNNNDYLRSLQESDLSMRSGNIDSRNFLLIHGTADKIVHPQHSLILARALIDQGVGFRHQVYTDEDHHLSRVWYHLYKTLDWFFDESFGPIESTDWDPTGFFAFKQ